MTDFDVAAAGDETARALTAAWALAAAHGRIRARHWSAEDEELSVDAATRFVAGRLGLEEAAAAVRESKAALAAARAELRGAAVAAVECGMPKRKVARDAGVSRMSLDDWLTPREW